MKISDKQPVSFPGLFKFGAVPRLIMGKLGAPSQTPDAIVRSRLINRIKQSDRRITIVTAPAGFGKSILLAQLHQSVEKEGIPTGWLTLDERDNDLGRFLVYLNQVASRLLPFDILPSPDIGNSSPTQYFSIKNHISLLVNKLTTTKNPFYIFIDEFEHIKNPEVIETIQELINYLPIDKKIIIGSRNTKSLHLSSLEISGQLLSLDESDLRFDQPEALALFNRQQKPQLTESDIEIVIARTQGWAAGIRLVLLSMKDQDKPTNWLENLSGSSDHIARYLAENVLSQLSDNARNFLISTSILEQLNSNLCNFLLDQTDSQELLTYFEQNNLFISRISQPLEPGVISYKYHALFRDFLFNELKARQPENIPTLNHKVANWYFSRNRLRPAVEHALQSDDMTLAATMMNKCIMGLIGVAQMDTAATWVNRIPTELAENQINIQRAKAYAMISLHKYHEAEAALARYQILEEAEGGDVSQEVCVQLALLHEFSDRHDRTAEDIKNFKKTPGDDPLLSSIACNISAYHHISNSEFESAIISLETAKQIYETSGPDLQAWPKVYSYCFEGLIEFLHGNLESATAIFEFGSKEAQGAAKSIAASFISRSQYEGDNLTQSCELIQKHIPTLKDTGDLDTIIMSYRTAARCAHLLGEHQQVDALLSELGNIGDRRGVNRAKASAWLEKCRFSLLKGDTESAKRYLELGCNKSIWSVHNGFHLFANEIEECELAELRMEIITGNPAVAIDRLPELIELASQNNRLYRRAHLQNLLAQAFYRYGDHAHALHHFKITIKFCEQHGLLRLLADEPWYINNMLNAFETSLCTAWKPYIDKLSTAISKNALDDSYQATPLILPNPLTPRETDLIKLVSEGCANKEIARLMTISENTVETHLKRINQKLETSNRTQAATKARELGAIQ
tara:strand:+ start:27287 stop:30025 length:2739 start_codon:yes stop_codon:yes gene_type:complete